MCSFHPLSLIFLFLAGAAFAAPAAAQDGPTSLWDLNESVLALYKKGSERTFRYHEPRTLLQQEGVRVGTVWFTGTLTGNTYTGTAFVFHRRCGRQPFAVEGLLDDDERRITFTGAQPMVFDDRCKPSAVEDVEFEITFVRSLAPPAPLVYGSIDHAPAAPPSEHPALFALLGERALQEQRLRDLRIETDRNERALKDQRDEAARIAAQRQTEEQRLAELRSFSEYRDSCRRYSISACDTALRSPHAHGHDAVDLHSWLAVALAFGANRDACRSGSFWACNAALASPALADEQRDQLEQWRAVASPYHRALVWLSTQITDSTHAAASVITAVRNLPASTHLTGGLAALLTLALAVMALRNRRPATSAQPAPSEMPELAAAPNALPHQATPSSDKSASAPQHAPQTFQCAPQSTASPKPGPPAGPASPVVRDTPGAIAALELAFAYIEEVREAERPSFEDSELRREHLNTLALAAKQLDAADKLDPDAILEGQDEKEAPYRYSINELKSEALFIEGLTHQTYDVKRAIPALNQATVLNPNNPHAFYILGLTQLANMNKSEAIAALERAVELDPKTIDYRKELDRAQNLSGGTIAAYKATRAGEKIFDAGVKTANAGIAVYNVGVFTWNVFAFTWNVLTFPLRMMFKMFGLFDRIMGAR